MEENTAFGRGSDSGQSRLLAHAQETPNPHPPSRATPGLSLRHLHGGDDQAPVHDELAESR